MLSCQKNITKFGKKLAIEFNSEPVYNKKYLKTKIKSFEGKINTNFYGNKIAKEVSECICQSLILINSVYRTGKNYYP